MGAAASEGRISARLGLPLPTMFFAENALTIECARAGLRLRFDALGALDAVARHAPTDIGVADSHAPFWRARR